MTPLSGPVFSSIHHEGYRYPQMHHTNIAIVSTILVYVVQSPQFIATYLMVCPDLGRGSIQNPNILLRVNQASQTMKEFKGDLVSKVTPLLSYKVPSRVASSVIWWEN